MRCLQEDADLPQCQPYSSGAGGGRGERREKKQDLGRETAREGEHPAGQAAP